MNDSLVNLGACSAEFLLHLFRINDIIDIIEDIIIDTFFHNLRCYSYNHLVFYNFLLSDSC